jgi:hypothetical protein
MKAIPSYLTLKIAIDDRKLGLGDSNLLLQHCNVSIGDMEIGVQA